MNITHFSMNNRNGTKHILLQIMSNIYLIVFCKSIGIRECLQLLGQTDKRIYNNRVNRKSESSLISDELVSMIKTHRVSKKPVAQQWAVKKR